VNEADVEDILVAIANLCAVPDCDAKWAVNDALGRILKRNFPQLCEAQQGQHLTLNFNESVGTKDKMG